MKVAELVYEFCTAHVGEKITMTQLHNHIAGKMPLVPGSGSRVLRNLRFRAMVNYVVVNKKVGEYLITAVH